MLVVLFNRWHDPAQGSDACLPLKGTKSLVAVPVKSRDKSFMTVQTTVVHAFGSNLAFRGLAQDPYLSLSPSALPYRPPPSNYGCRGWKVSCDGNIGGSLFAQAITTSMETIKGTAWKRRAGRILARVKFSSLKGNLQVCILVCMHAQVTSKICVLCKILIWVVINRGWLTGPLPWHLMHYINWGLI